jgi:hypothetical protein
MMLEVAYKAIANIMQRRLSKISEALPHEGVSAASAQDEGAVTASSTSFRR